jgi:hypothetical protein
MTHFVNIVVKHSRPNVQKQDIVVSNVIKEITIKRMLRSSKNIGEKRNTQLFVRVPNVITSFRPQD